MSLKLNVGICKKIAQPDFGSLGASCHVEVELDPSLIFNDVAGVSYSRSSKRIRPVAKPSTTSLPEGKQRPANKCPTVRRTRRRRNWFNQRDEWPTCYAETD